MTSYEVVRDLIEAHTPASVEIPMDRVHEIVSQYGYTLVPCREVSSTAQISNETNFAGGKLIKRWFLKDIEEADYRVFLQDDGKYLIFHQSERPTGTYVPIIDAWRILEQEGYKLYYLYSISDEIQLVRGQTKKQWVDDDGFRCFSGKSLRIYWYGVLNGDVITYECAVAGGSTDRREGLPAELLQAFFAEVGAATITVKIEPPFVTMPEPDWVYAGEYYIHSEQLPLPEAQPRAIAFVKQMADAGLFPTKKPVVVDLDDLEALMLLAHNIDDDVTKALLSRLEEVVSQYISD